MTLHKHRTIKTANTASIKQSAPEYIIAIKTKPKKNSHYSQDITYLVDPRNNELTKVVGIQSFGRWLQVGGLRTGEAPPWLAALSQLAGLEEGGGGGREAHWDLKWTSYGPSFLSIRHHHHIWIDHFVVHLCHVMSVFNELFPSLFIVLLGQLCMGSLCLDTKGLWATYNIALV